MAGNPEKSKSEAFLQRCTRVWGPKGVWSRIVASVPGLRALWPDAVYPAGMQEQLDSGMIPVKFAECLEYNQLIKTCCRQVENMGARLFKTNRRLRYPDMWVATCRECGCNHIRVRHDPVRLGRDETLGERIANSTSILDHPYNSAPEGDL